MELKKIEEIGSGLKWEIGNIFRRHDDASAQGKPREEGSHILKTETRASRHPRTGGAAAKESLEKEKYRKESNKKGGKQFSAQETSGGSHIPKTDP